VPTAHGVATASLRVERGRVRYRGPTRALEELPLRDARASFSIDEERLRANATLALGQWLSAEGRLDAALAASGAGGRRTRG
jgi:hypothetical protein